MVTSLSEKVMKIFNEACEGYLFVMPGAMVSSTEVQREYDRTRHVWVLTYESDGGQWRGEGDTILKAYLALIAHRLGEGEKEEDEDG